MCNSKSLPLGSNGSWLLPENLFLDKRIHIFISILKLETKNNNSIINEHPYSKTNRFPDPHKISNIYAVFLRFNLNVYVYITRYNIYNIVLVKINDSKFTLIETIYIYSRTILLKHE